MVRPLSKDEQNDLDKLFGGGGTQTSSGFLGGTTTPSMGAATQGGKFSGDSAGTGFVNADQYLGANQGKGLALGDKITEGAGDTAKGLDTGLGDFKTSSPGAWSAPDSPYKDLIDGKGGGKHSSKEYGDAEDYFSRKEGAYDSQGARSDVDRKYNSLMDLKGKAADWSSKLDPNAADARTTRSGLLKDKARESGIYGYGDNAQAFDSMFMEAESPDLISRKYNSLQNALSGFSGIDQLYGDKKSAINQNQANSDAFYTASAQKAKEMKDATAARENKEKQQTAGDGVTFKPDITTTDINDKVTDSHGTSVSTGTRTDYPDGSYDIKRDDGTVVHYDRNGNIASYEDPNGIFS